MRHLFSFIVIAFSTSALLGGFLSGRAAVPHVPAVPTPAAQSTLSPDLLRQAPMDEVAHDEFAGDSAVAIAPSAQDFQGDARLSVVIVDAGRSFALESPFLSLNVPLTLVIDPKGSAAFTMYELAIERGDAVYVQLEDWANAATLRELRRRFPRLAGVAIRPAQSVPPGDLAALRTAKLAFFDERDAGDGAAARFASAGVRYAARGITVDDHAQRSYVTYMLQEAVHLARGRIVVVMARPFPGTLQGFQDLLARAPRDGVHVVGLP